MLINLIIYTLRNDNDQRYKLLKPNPNDNIIPPADQISVNCVYWHTIK